MSAFRHAALVIDDLRCRLGCLDHVRQSDAKRYADDGLAAQHDEARRQLAGWLASVRDGIEQELAALQRPPDEYDRLMDQEAHLSDEG